MDGRLHVGIGVDAELATDPVKREAPDAVGEEASATAQEGAGSSGVHGIGKVAELMDDLVGDGVRRDPDRSEQRQNILGGQPGIGGIDHELEQRRARDAERVRVASLHDAGRLECLEVVRDHRRDQYAQLIQSGWRAGLVDVNELVGFDAEYVAQVRPRRPVAQEVADAGERVAAVPKSSDEVEPTDVSGSVQADPADPAGRGKDPEGLVLADGANGQGGERGELIDRPRVDRRGVGLESVRSGDHIWTVPDITVTVNTVTDNSAIAAAMDRLLAEAWPGTALDAAPAPLAGGFWASMYRIHLRGQPGVVPADLVFRVAPDASMGAKEAAVQKAVSELGFPTPAVRLVGRVDDGVGGRWSVMDFARGSPPLDDLNGLAALRRAPRLFARLPAQLAESMTELHALDPDVVSSAVRIAAPTVAWSVDDLLEHYEAGAEALGRADLVMAIDALRRDRPREGATVICHGDLHPFNLLVDEHGTPTVVDWTASVRAEPAYDVAFTALLLRNPPLAASGALGVVIRFIGARLAGKFIARYRRLAPRHRLDQLGWYEALHGSRLLLQAASLEARDGPIDGGHPFAALVPAGSAALETITRTPIRTR